MYSYSSTFIYSLLRGQVITTVLYFIILCFAQYEIEISWFCSILSIHIGTMCSNNRR
uniref:Uncharacterized protein n=1 Tax=Siphoviridae sp. ctCIv11 TaxID=2827806 RepID=A0A8S5S310_9CAUD|nr:MAG TPA: hypothetical protein [Siphoviridae sp. ctCIv11]